MKVLDFFCRIAFHDRIINIVYDSELLANEIYYVSLIISCKEGILFSSDKKLFTVQPL